MATRKNNQAVAAFVEQAPERADQSGAVNKGTGKGRSGSEHAAPWDLTPSELFPGTHQATPGAQCQDEQVQGGVLKRLLQGRKSRQTASQGSRSAELNGAGQAQAVTASEHGQAEANAAAAGRAGANGTALKGLKGRAGKKAQTKSGTTNVKTRLSKGKAAAGGSRSAGAQVAQAVTPEQAGRDVPQAQIPAVAVREREFSWEVAREELMERSERRAWNVARGAVVLSVALGLSLCALLPLKSVEPFVIEVDKSNGMSRVLHLAYSEEIPVDEMSHKYWLSQYVLARESYDWRTLNQDYYKVRELSLPQVFEVYNAQYGENNEDSLERKYRDDVRIKVLLKSVVVHNDYIATVRLTKVRYDNRSGLETGRESLTATLAFEYFPDFKVPEERRLINPFGFKVTSYRTDPEHEDEGVKTLPGTAQESAGLLAAAEVRQGAAAPGAQNGALSEMGLQESGLNSQGLIVPQLGAADRSVGQSAGSKR